MKVENITKQKMFVLVAPDGSIQITTLTTSYEECIAYVRLLHHYKMGKSLHELKLKGFVIAPVEVSINKI